MHNAVLELCDGKAIFLERLTASRKKEGKEKKGKGEKGETRRITSTRMLKRNRRRETRVLAAKA